MDPTKEVSRELFELVKPKCVELSDVILSLPNLNVTTATVVNALKAVFTVIETHKRRFIVEQGSSISPNESFYCISDKLADYIFFPISNLLQKGTSNVLVKTYVIGIIHYLLDSAWKFKPNPALFNQLHQLIIHLAIDNVDYKNVSADEEQTFFELKRAVMGCLQVTIGSTFPSFFDEDIKILSLYGRTMDLTLNILANSTNPHSLEETEFVELCLSCLNQIIELPILPDNLSRVFPGVVSNLVNFYVRSKTLNYKIICDIIDTLDKLIVKVFDDLSLLVSVEQPDISTRKLVSLWDNHHEELSKVTTGSIELELQNNSNVRTKSWLIATSKQLKISLTILFKDLISIKNRSKVQTKHSIGQHVNRFVQNVFENCFYSLYNDFTPLALDIISAIITIEKTDRVDDSKYLEVANNLTLDSNIEQISNKRTLLYKFVKLKIDDMIHNKLTLVFYSFDDERIKLFLGSLKFHFAFLHSLSNDLSLGCDGIEACFESFVKTLSNELLNATTFGRKNSKISTNELIDSLNRPVPTKTANDENSTIPQYENKLDNIELPAHIDASKVTRISSETSVPTQQTLRKHFSTLRDISTDINNRAENFEMVFFDNMISKDIELESADLLKYITGLLPEESSCRILDFISSIDETFRSATSTSQGIGLWIANNILKGCKSNFTQPSVDFNVDEFLDLDSDDESRTITEGNALISDVSYIILDQALHVLEDVSEKISSSEAFDIKNKNLMQSRELSLSIALQSIGTVCKYLDMESFQRDVLMDNLFMILECLTFQATPVVQAQAKECLQKINLCYYHGSFESLIRENLDYLIDSISIRLSSALSLTPSISGIMLVILKVSGVKLLLDNQLNDVFLELFVLIDTYHGYSLLMEGFFAVFAELIDQIKLYYSKTTIGATGTELTSNYKPWGLESVEQVLKLLDDSNKIVDSFQDYDSTKEYFTKRRDVPFSEQLNDDDEAADSDDESEEEDPDDDDEKEKEPWPSYISENIYHLLERIFTYGFQLLSHPSMYLKNQILRILKEIYPLLATNPKLLLPLISNHWSELMPLTIGTTSLSTSTPLQYDSTQMNLVIPALEFILVAIDEDVNMGESFLARKVLDMWEFWLQRVPFFKNSNSSVTHGDKLSKLVINPSIIRAYVGVISKSLEAYDKIIPDIMNFKMTAICKKLGMNSKDLNRSMENSYWVLCKLDH